MLCEDLILEMVPILNQKELFQENANISDDVRMLCGLILTEVGGYKREFVDNISDRQRKQINTDKYLQQANLIGKYNFNEFSTTHNSNKVYQNKRYKASLALEDLAQIKSDSIEYLESQNNFKLDKGNFSDFTEIVVEQLIDELVEDQFQMMDKVQDRFVRDVVEEEIQKMRG